MPTPLFKNKNANIKDVIAGDGIEIDKTDLEFPVIKALPTTSGADTSFSNINDTAKQVIKNTSNDGAIVGYTQQDPASNYNPNNERTLNKSVTNFICYDGFTLNNLKIGQKFICYQNKDWPNFTINNIFGFWEVSAVTTTTFNVRLKLISTTKKVTNWHWNDIRALNSVGNREWYQLSNMGEAQTGNPASIPADDDIVFLKRSGAEIGSTYNLMKINKNGRLGYASVVGGAGTDIIWTYPSDYNNTGDHNDTGRLINGKKIYSYAFDSGGYAVDITNTITMTRSAESFTKIIKLEAFVEISEEQFKTYPANFHGMGDESDVESNLITSGITNMAGIGKSFVHFKGDNATYRIYGTIEYTID